MSAIKIRKLLAEANCSPDTVDKIVLVLEGYKQKVDAERDKKIKECVEASKKTVAEEVEAFMIDLGDKVSLYLESKAATVDSFLKSQSVASESQVTAKLKKVHALVEGVELDSKPDSKDKAKISKLMKENARLADEYKQKIDENTRLQSLSSRLIEQNRTLVSNTKPSPVITESRIPSKQTSKPGKPAPKKPAVQLNENVNQPKTDEDFIKDWAKGL